ncbi:hypothetical protein TKK_0002342 [Trichogramma kaykai]
MSKNNQRIIFSPEEKELLAKCIAPHSDAIFSVKRQKPHITAKEKAWEEVNESFNQRNQLPRTMDQIKNCFRNYKKYFQDFTESFEIDSAQKKNQLENEEKGQTDSENLKKDEQKDPENESVSEIEIKNDDDVLGINIDMDGLSENFLENSPDEKNHETDCKPENENQSEDETKKSTDSHDHTPSPSSSSYEQDLKKTEIILVEDASKRETEKKDEKKDLEGEFPSEIKNDDDLLWIEKKENFLENALEEKNPKIDKQETQKQDDETMNMVNLKGKLENLKYRCQKLRYEILKERKRAMKARALLFELQVAEAYERIEAKRSVSHSEMNRQKLKP